MMTSLTIGQPAPFDVPAREGYMMEIGYPLPGLNVMCQYPNLYKKELEIFNMPLVAYSYQETGTVVPIAWRVFRFRHNLYVETTFDAKQTRYDEHYLATVREYLQPVDNMVKNRIFFLILALQSCSGNYVIDSGLAVSNKPGCSGHG